MSEDDIYFKEIAKRCKRIFPQEFDLVEATVDENNFYHALTRGQILFKSDVSDKQRQKTRSAILAIQKGLDAQGEGKQNNWYNDLRREITKSIIDLAEKNAVIVDTWFLKPEHIQQISDRHKTVHVAVYCSLPEMINRTIKRNSGALVDGKDISNLRFFRQSLASFTRNYDLSDNSEDSIDSLDKRTVLHELDIVELCLAPGESRTFYRAEFSSEGFQQYKRELVEKFENHDVLYVVPRFEHDRVLKTDEASPNECAEEIIRLINRIAG